MDLDLLLGEFDRFRGEERLLTGDLLRGDGLLGDLLLDLRPNLLGDRDRDRRRGGLLRLGDGRLLGGDRLLLGDEEPLLRGEGERLPLERDLDLDLERGILI